MSIKIKLNPFAATKIPAESANDRNTCKVAEQVAAVVCYTVKF